MNDKVIVGNLLDMPRPCMIGHQVNLRGVAGAGLAKQISDRWLGWRIAFQAHPATAGDSWIWKGDSPFIASLYGQDGYGRTKRHTRYGWLAMALVSAHAQSLSLEAQLYLPFGLGCGLAGGNWAIVSELISDCAPSAIVVQLP